MSPFSCPSPSRRLGSLKDGGQRKMWERLGVNFAMALQEKGPNSSEVEERGCTELQSVSRARVPVQTYLRARQAWPRGNVPGSKQTERCRVKQVEQKVLL